MMSANVAVAHKMRMRVLVNSNSCELRGRPGFAPQLIPSHSESYRKEGAVVACRQEAPALYRATGASSSAKRTCPRYG